VLCFYCVFLFCFAYFLRSFWLPLFHQHWLWSLTFHSFLPFCFMSYVLAIFLIFSTDAFSWNECNFFFSYHSFPHSLPHIPHYSLSFVKLLTLLLSFGGHSQLLMLMLITHSSIVLWWSLSTFNAYVKQKQLNKFQS
jgi:hypothetical protein